MITKAKKLLALLLALCMSLALAACSPTANPTPSGGSPSTPVTSGAPDPTPSQTGGKPEGIQPGTVFNHWINYDIPSHIPWVDNRGTFLYLQVYDNLLYKHHADQNDIRGNLAESWKVSDDGLVWVFQIKKDAYFTSGNQVNAEAFVKTWDVAKENNPRFFAPVTSYVATGEFELTITLSSPSATFIYDLPMQSIVGVVDPAALAQYGTEDNRGAVGSGPYYIDQHISGEKIVLKANPNYHNPDRAPHIETVNFVIIPDENTALLALLNGELDSLATVNIEVYNNLIAQGWAVQMVEDRSNPFWFNAREVELFRDGVVREALCHMIDWQAVTDLVYDGLFPVPDSIWPGPGRVPYGDNYKYDPQLGIKMLEDAGYKKDDIKFTMLADPDFTNLEIAIQAQFQALGFNNIGVETLDGATCYGMLKSGTYQMFPCHNGWGVESPLTTYSMGLLPNGSQRCMWLDYIDEAAYAEALAAYDRANKAPNFAAYLKEVEAITKICQDYNLSMGGVQVMRMFGIAEQFEDVHIAPITGYFDFCYLWNTKA